MNLISLTFSDRDAQLKAAPLLHQEGWFLRDMSLQSPYLLFVTPPERLRVELENGTRDWKWFADMVQFRFGAIDYSCIAVVQPGVLM